MQLYIDFASTLCVDLSIERVRILIDRLLFFPCSWSDIDKKSPGTTSHHHQKIERRLKTASVQGSTNRSEEHGRTDLLGSC